MKNFNFCRNVFSFSVLFSLIMSLSLSQQSKAGVLLQGFYWDAWTDQAPSWWDYLAQKAPEIRSAGFTAVWIPPVWKGASGGYSNGYDLFDDYDIGSKDQRSTYATHWGNRNQLQNACATLRANHLDIYLDTNLNHRQGDDGSKNFKYVGSPLSSQRHNFESGRFAKGPFDFHYHDGEFGRMLNQDNSYVHENLIAAGDWISKALDIQGMRFDFAKADSPQFMSKYLNSQQMKNHFAVVEYWGSQDEIKKFIADSQFRVSAFDFPLWNCLRDLANSQGFFDMRRLSSCGLVNEWPQSAVTFVENHDTDQSYKSFDKKLGYAFILTSQGYPSVFWKDFFFYNLKEDLKNLIWIHENLAKGETIYRWADDDVLSYERVGGNGLIVGLNDHRFENKTVKVATQFGSFQWLHDYSGHGSDIQTDANGYAEITIAPNNYVAYSKTSLKKNSTSTSKSNSQNGRTTQEYAGSFDLDLSPLIQSESVFVTELKIQEDEPVNGELYLPDSTLKFVTQAPNEKISITLEVLKNGLPFKTWTQNLNSQIATKGQSPLKFNISLVGSKKPRTFQKTQSDVYAFLLKLNSQELKMSDYWFRINFLGKK